MGWTVHAIWFGICLIAAFMTYCKGRVDECKARDEMPVPTKKLQVIKDLPSWRTFGDEA